MDAIIVILIGLTLSVVFTKVELKRQRRRIEMLEAFRDKTTAWEAE